MTKDPIQTLALEPLVLAALSEVYDPEIPVDIQELGLIYGIEVDSARHVRVRMTLTAPSCPSAQALPAEVRRVVRAVPGVSDATVEVVWDPPWTTDRMSDAARLQLGLL